MNNRPNRSSIEPNRTERTEHHMSVRRSLLRLQVWDPTALNWPQTRSKKLPVGPFCAFFAL
eukprot:2205109-Alexandrium_andersonii.AAC.1